MKLLHILISAILMLGFLYPIMGFAEKDKKVGFIKFKGILTNHTDTQFRGGGNIRSAKGGSIIEWTLPPPLLKEKSSYSIDFKAGELDGAAPIVDGQYTYSAQGKQDKSDIVKVDIRFEATTKGLQNPTCKVNSSKYNCTFTHKSYIGDTPVASTRNIRATFTISAGGDNKH